MTLMTALKAQSKATLGVAVDEVVLAGAMLGSMGIFAMTAVPWDTVLGPERAEPLPEVVMIEQANAEFYLRHRKWPHEVTDGNWRKNAAALATQQVLKYPYQSMSQFSPVLTALPFDVTEQDVALRHEYGKGGRILQGPSDDAKYSIKIIFENMPLAEVQNMDLAIDSEDSLEDGRLRAQFEGARVDMVYYANPKS